jgi:TPR repeat protein
MRRITVSILACLIASAAMGDAMDDGLEALKAQRWADAYRILLPEAKGGNSLAQYNLALLLSEGLGVAKDLPQAAQWYERAANSGDLEAKVNLGLMYVAGEGVKRDPVRAVQLYREAANEGNGMAQNNLGAAYLKGEGVERDDAEALRWLNKAAEQNVSQAQNTLGGLYCGGDKRPNPIKIDDELCNKWIKSAAALGNEDAKATMFFLTKKSAERGELQAMQNLGGYYLQGYGTQADARQGVDWLTKAAEAGFKPSQNVLSQLYERGGLGVAADAKKAAYWKSKYAGK